MANSQISVIIPTYNRANVVCEAVESVLSQTSPPMEIIVIDDGSTDPTRKSLSYFGNHIRYFYQQNKGVSSARNRGILESNGRWLAFLDSDDIWLQDIIEMHMQAIKNHPLITAHVVNMEIERQTSGKTDLFSFRGFSQRHAKSFTLARPLAPEVKYHFAWVQNTLVRKDAAKKAGPFIEGLHIFEDLDFFFRLALTGQWHITPSVHARVRRKADEQKPLSDQNRLLPVESLSTLIDIHTRICKSPEIQEGEKKAVLTCKRNFRKLLALKLLKLKRIRESRAQFLSILAEHVEMKAILGYILTYIYGCLGRRMLHVLCGRKVL